MIVFSDFFSPEKNQLQRKCRETKSGLSYFLYVILFLENLTRCKRILKVQDEK